MQLGISHSAGLGMLAVSPSRVGVDLEALRSVPVEEIAGATLTVREHRALHAEPRGLARSRSFLRCWTRKEAVLKAVGTGISTDLTKLESYAWIPGPAQMTTSGPGEPTTWQVTEVPVPDGWVASLALPLHTRGDVTVRQF
ncbi:MULTISPECIES: 4'-phosphopantetheinyl transferase family protein [unclassified Streptomyces]|uniref:4'-phosphopantetheinyl transferase family protein n=1 Tax=unclassified Streptomyces TaxID=2593676 RepID=UPI0035E20BF2